MLCARHFIQHAKVVKIADDVGMTLLLSYTPTGQMLQRFFTNGLHLNANKTNNAPTFSS